jgi:prepilin signal peptidase PulO-like enzyme (type II secretory pathway)
LLVWSNNIWLASFVVILISFVLLISKEITRWRQSLDVFLISFPSIFFALIANYIPELEDSNRKYWGLCAITLTTVLSAISLKFQQPKKDLGNMNAKEMG